MIPATCAATATIKERLSPAAALDKVIAIAAGLPQPETRHEIHVLRDSPRAGPIHGNASVSSVLPLMWDSRTRVLVDLDSFTVGPREWDLVLTAMYFERFGWHTDNEYLEFASGYGFDVMRWPGYPVLRNIRELILLTWLALNPSSLPEIHAEVSGRIADLRNGDAD